MGDILRSVGLDVGTTTTQLILSELTEENRASGFAVPHMQITDRKIVYESPVLFTPLLGSLVDSAAIRRWVQSQYTQAGIEAKDVDTKLIFFSIVSCLLVSVGLVIASPFIPMIYNTTDEVRHLASWFIIITAICTPLFAFANSCYFTLRSGGKTVLTFLFDSVFVWVVSVPLAFCLSRFTGLPIVPLYAICVGVDITKCAVGFFMIRKGVWIRNLTA